MLSCPLGGHLFRNSEKPKEVIILWDWESHSRAREYFQSPELRVGMQRAGVSESQLFFLQDPANLTARSRFL